jgi:hypothetical protein
MTWRLQLGFTRGSLGFRVSAISEGAAAPCKPVTARSCCYLRRVVRAQPIATRWRRRASYCVRDFGFGTAELGSMAARERDHSGREAHVGVWWSERLLPGSGPASPRNRHSRCLVRLLTVFGLRLGEEFNPTMTCPYSRLRSLLEDGSTPCDSDVLCA